MKPRKAETEVGTVPDVETVINDLRLVIFDLRVATNDLAETIARRQQEREGGKDARAGR